MAILPERCIDRFWSNVDTDSSDGCWLWKLSVGSHGYGQVGWWENGRSRMVLAHRVSYELLVGPIPDGLQLDHLCRVRLCVNPSHLEAVTQRENILRSDSPTAVNARKKHCHRGHEFTPQNTGIRANGWRDCLACQADRKAVA